MCDELSWHLDINTLGYLEASHAYDPCNKSWFILTLGKPEKHVTILNRRVKEVTEIF